MRMGVLDIGSNTGHLLIVDAFRGGPPVAAYSHKEPLRLAEHLEVTGELSAEGISSLVKFVEEAKAGAADQGCTEVISFATSAVRDAVNADEVLDQVRSQTGISLEVLPGEDEARLTFLAVRRWFGWSSGRLGVFDIGGGSLEIAVGSDEEPEVAVSYPLGAGRLTREWLESGRDADELRLHVRAVIAQGAGSLLRRGSFDHAVATSKTFRSLARVCGAAPSDEGPYVRRQLSRVNLAKAADRLAVMTPDEVAALEGVSPARAHQMQAGSVVALATMDLFGLETLEICPWALREGVLLERIDHL